MVSFLLEICLYVQLQTKAYEKAQYLCIFTLGYCKAIIGSFLTRQKLFTVFKLMLSIEGLIFQNSEVKSQRTKSRMSPFTSPVSITPSFEILSVSIASIFSSILTCWFGIERYCRIIRNSHVWYVKIFRQEDLNMHSCFFWNI